MGVHIHPVPRLARTRVARTDESIRTELGLRGYTGARLEAELRRITEESIRGVRDWLGYSDFGNGNITDAEPNRTIFIPDPESAVQWYERYNELSETVDNEDDE